ncbi:MAG: glycosyltransferase family protein [Candidatus Omnitrophica bacterium]|nr:glycosyltransferase family protein [Candidatus Omnitrophota bacterium]
MKITAIIQARTGSSRLPGKVLLKIKGRTVLEYVIRRTMQARTIDKVILATTERHHDNAVDELGRDLGVITYRGSEDDVLDRYYRCAREYDAKHIARITADCPLIDPSVIDRVSEEYLKSSPDYCSNVLERTFPVGLDVEVFGISALEKAWENARLQPEREHVTPYMIKHPEIFRQKNVSNSADLSGKRWTLDRREDFEFIKAVIEGVYSERLDFRMQDIVEFLARRPELEHINSNVKSQRGHSKSPLNDKALK